MRELGRAGGKAGPLFETPAARVLDATPPDVRGALRPHIEEPPLAIGALRDQIATYLVELEEKATTCEFLDLQLARRVGARCRALLDGLQTDPPEETRQLVQAAVRYFVTDEDAEGDSSSPIGFDDDALVVEVVAKELGREDVLALEPDSST